MVNICFKINDNGEIKNVSYDENMIIKDFIRDFLSKNPLYATLESNSYMFSINARKLNNPRFQNKKLKDLIWPKCLVYFHSKKDQQFSGFSMEFIDVSKKHIMNQGILTNPPDYRATKKGINIFANCKNLKCILWDKEVIVPINKDIIDLVEEKYDIRCPKCDGVTKPKSIGFYLCQYHIYGTKIEDKVKAVSFDNGIVDANDSEFLKRYDYILGGICLFTSLIVEIVKYY